MLHSNPLVNGWSCAAVLTRANLRTANLRGAGLRAARLDEADLRDARLGAAFLVEASLRGADLRGAYLLLTKLDGADLSGADLRGTEGLTRAQLAGAHCDIDELRLNADRQEVQRPLTRDGEVHA